MMVGKTGQQSAFVCQNTVICVKCRLPMSKSEETRPMESFYNIVQDAIVITGTAAYLERLLYFFFPFPKCFFLVYYVLCLITFV